LFALVKQHFGECTFELFARVYVGDSIPAGVAIAGLRAVFPAHTPPAQGSGWTSGGRGSQKASGSETW